MNNRLRKTKGFTLAELLIVVAIIGVLVAVSIPIFTGQLEKSRIATDKANVRSAKAAAVAQHLSDGATGVENYYYNSNGTIQKSADGIKGYGKSTKADDDGTITGAKTSGGNAPKGGYVKVTIDENALITAYWEDGEASNEISTDSGTGSLTVDVGYARPNGDGATRITSTTKFTTPTKSKYYEKFGVFQERIKKGEGHSSGESVQEDGKLYVYAEPGYDGSKRSPKIGNSDATTMAEFTADPTVADHYAIIDQSTYTYSIEKDSKDTETKYHKKSIALVGDDYYVAVYEGATAAEINENSKWVKIK